MICICGHTFEEHLVVTTTACTKCECDKYSQASPFSIRTILSENGDSRVCIEWGSSTLQVTPDAAVQIGLNLISAAYAGRGEAALFQHCTQNNLDPKEVIGLVRRD